jgi:hypothetical protein
MMSFSHRNRTFAIAAALFLLLAESAAAQELFPDQNLAAAIRDTLKKKEGEALKEEDLKDVFILHAGDKGIENLAGLERCVNLAEAKFSGNKIADLKPLAGLKNLQSLYLADNRITDVGPLKDLVKLQHLELQGNQIENLEPLGGLTAMASLYVARNKVKDLSPLVEMQKLASLDAAKNQLKDIGPVGKLKWVRTLDLAGNQIVDVSPLSPLTELSLTLLQNNQVKDLAPLVEMAKKDFEGEKRFAPYWRLYLGGNPLGEQAAAQIEQLKKYGVRVDTELK